MAKLITYSKFLIFFSMLIFSACKSSVDLQQICQSSSDQGKLGVNCSSYAGSKTPATVNGPAAFTIEGTVTGTNFSGKNIICSTVENLPTEAGQTLTSDGNFSIRFDKTGEIPVRCMLAESDNSSSIDIVFTKSVTRSIKSESILKHLVLVRKKDTTAIDVGNVVYDDTNKTSEIIDSAVTQNGSKAFSNLFSDLSGVWNSSSDIALTTFANNMTGSGIESISEIRWNQAEALDDLGQLHVGLGSWQRDSSTDSLAGCGGAEGYPLQSGWSATSNVAAFSAYSNSAVDFSNINNVSGLADFFYANNSQNVCGVDLTGGLTTNALCSEVTFPANYNGLNANQCKLLCVIKSIDSLRHFAANTGEYSACPSEFKTNLTSASLATQLPASGNCTAANGDPCPGLITKPELVVTRNFFEEATIISDTASFSSSRIDSVRSCSDNNLDGDTNDSASGPFPADCNDCRFQETISVVIRQMSTTQGYASQRISRVLLPTNDPLVCLTGSSFEDQAYFHRMGVLGGVLQLSHTYLMNKN